MLLDTNADQLARRVTIKAQQEETEKKEWDEAGFDMEEREDGGIAASIPFIASPTTSAFPSHKRKVSNMAEAQGSKKQKVMIESRELHLRWRGRETGEGQIENIHEIGGKEGVIEFLDSTCTNSRGWFDNEYCGDHTGFTGIKTCDDSTQHRVDTCSNWADLSPNQHEREQ